MSRLLPKSAVADSTYVVTVGFFDTDGSAITPTSVKWSLRDQTGAIVNSRSSIYVAATNGKATIVLSGADLHITTATSKLRLELDAVYTSTLGSDLPLKDSVWIKVVKDDVLDE